MLTCALILMTLLYPTGLDKASVTAIIKASTGACVVQAMPDAVGHDAVKAMRTLAKTPVQRFEVTTPLGMSFDGAASKGYFVTKVKPGSNAAKAGVAASMTLLSVNGTPTLTLEKLAVTAAIKASKGVCVIEAKPDAAGHDAFKAARAETNSKVPQKSLQIPTPLGMQFDGAGVLGFFVTKVRPVKVHNGPPIINVPADLSRWMTWRCLATISIFSIAQLGSNLQNIALPKPLRMLVQKT